jgi:HK97 family phage major capsid protein
MTIELENIKAEIEEQKQAINSISLAIGNASLAGEYAPENSEEALGLKSFLKSGDLLETKSYNSSVSNDGGFTISPKIQNAVNSSIAEDSVIRKLAKIEQISTSSLEIICNSGSMEAGWTMETDDRKITQNGSFIKKVINVHELYAQPKASQRFLDDSFVNVESWLKEEISSSFANLEARAFIKGDGNKMPRGVLSAASEDNNMQLSEALSSDNLLDLIYLLPAKFHKNASFVMHPETVCMIRKLKENNSGRFLWNPSLESSRPSSILGIPVYEDANMPRPSEEGPHILLADFKQSYRIVDRSGMHLLRDPFTDKPFVKFYVTKRVGGDVVNDQAMVFLTLASN